MTTAHKATFHTAKGGKDQGGNKAYVPSKNISAKDQPSLLNLKRRADNVFLKPLTREKLKKELYEKENGNYLKNNIKEDTLLAISDIYNNSEITGDLLEIVNSENKSINKVFKNQYTNQSYVSDINSNTYPISLLDGNPEDQDEIFEDDDSKNLKESTNIFNTNIINNNIDELTIEYNKIKKQKEDNQKLLEFDKSEKIKKLENAQEILNYNKNDKISISEISSNNLLYNNKINNLNSNNTQEYSFKKKWYQDTIFTNQAREEKKPEKIFINDTTGSEKYKQFINKTIH